MRFNQFESASEFQILCLTLFIYICIPASAFSMARAITTRLQRRLRNTRCRPLPSPTMEICSARSAFMKPRKKPASNRSSAAKCMSPKTNRLDRDPASGRPNHLIVLCENEKGYQNLVKLVSKGYLDGFYYKPRIDKELLREHSEGLIGLSACLNGEVSANVLAGRLEQAEKAAAEYQDIFGKDRFFLEIHDHGLEKQRKIIPDMLRIGERTGIRVAATNDCHYMHQDDSRAHDILLCIQTGKTVNDPNRMKFYTDQFYFKTREDMDRVFGEIPHVLDQTVEIAERCSLKLQKVENPFPEFVVPPGFTIDTYFAKVVRDGFQDRLAHLKPMADRGVLKNSIGRLRSAARTGDPDHPADEVSRIFSDRLGSHPLCARERHPGRSGPRFCRRKSRFLLHAHYGHRPAAVWAAV